ncbi:MAG: deoxynucleoside kinase [Bacilli bacterium]|nr:deoxynucleoside kinase [Bacilli bacterium]
MRGKIIVIEGTDCSGKETQSKLLVKKLKEAGINAERFGFPCYETATGKIVGGPLLGKKYIGESYFLEGLPNVDSKIVSLYTAADRKYNIKLIIDKLNAGINVVLDRYVYSNMAFQGAKFKDDLQRLQFFEWIESLEFGLLELPKSDINIFLHMNIDQTIELLSKRKEDGDANERCPEYLKKCEQTYLLLVSKYNFKTIECVKNDKIRDIDDINNELYRFVFNNLK